MPYREYSVHGKCRNCGKEIHITSIPEMYVGFSGLTNEDMLIALINSGTISQLHECADGRLGIVEPTYFEENN